MEYDNTNTGAIFKNESATGNQPTYKGKINVDGVNKQIALWVKQSKDGKPFFSVKISDEYTPAPANNPGTPKDGQSNEFDSLPF